MLNQASPPLLCSELSPDEMYYMPTTAQLGHLGSDLTITSFIYFSF